MMDADKVDLIISILIQHGGQHFNINNETKNRAIYEEMESLGLIKINKALAGNCSVSYTADGLELLANLKTAGLDS